MGVNKEGVRKMKQCCRCCAELNDNVGQLYEYNYSLYCYDCLLEKLLEDGLIQEINEDEELE